MRSSNNQTMSLLKTDSCSKHSLTLEEGEGGCLNGLCGTPQSGQISCSDSSLESSSAECNCPHSEHRSYCLFSLRLSAEKSSNIKFIKTKESTRYSTLVCFVATSNTILPGLFSTYSVLLVAVSQSNRSRLFREISTCIILSI